MRNFKYPVALASLILSVGSSSVVVAAPSEPAAVAVRVACAGDKCTVTREGRKHLLRPLMPLYPGDMIVVRGNGLVEIGTADRASVHLDAKTGAYRVTVPRKPAGMLLRMWRQLADMFSEEEATEASAAARAAPIHPPPAAFCGIPAGTPLRIVAGTRRLAVPVKDGVGPFRLTVRDEAGSVLADGKTASTHWLVTAPVVLVPGRVAIAVNDTGGDNILRLDVDVVEATPAMSADLAISGLSDPAKRELRLVWLASEANDVWTLEAATEAAESASANAMPALFALRCSAR